MNLFWCLCVYLGVQGCIWKFMDVLDVYGCIGVYFDVYECIWGNMSVFRCTGM